MLPQYSLFLPFCLHSFPIGLLTSLSALFPPDYPGIPASCTPRKTRAVVPPVSAASVIENVHLSMSPEYSISPAPFCLSDDLRHSLPSRSSEISFTYLGPNINSFDFCAASAAPSTTDLEVPFHYCQANVRVQAHLTSRCPFIYLPYTPLRLARPMGAIWRLSIHTGPPSPLLLPNFIRPSPPSLEDPPPDTFVCRLIDARSLFPIFVPRGPSFKPFPPPLTLCRD